MSPTSAVYYLELKVSMLTFWCIILILFQSLTNWGRDAMYPDYIADDDSVMVTVFYQVCPGLSLIIVGKIWNSLII
jgi:hypothetical protein